MGKTFIITVGSTKQQKYGGRNIESGIWKSTKLILVVKI